MTELKPKPEGVELPDDREWEELPPATRYYYRNREEEKKRLSERKQKLKRWYEILKAEKGCARCDENHPGCLQFHHVGEKDAEVSHMVADGYSKENIKEEMEKCIILCANCHRKEHYSGTPPKPVEERLNE